MIGRSYKKRRERFELLASWYGTEAAATEIAAHTDQPSNNGLVREVDKLLREVQTPENCCLFELISQWRKLSGPAFSKFTQPVRIAQGVLELEVRHSGLIPELTPSLDLLLEHVHQNPEFALISSIRLVISGSGRK